MIMNVAVPALKHSPRFGHFADAHTVFRPSSAINPSTSANAPVRAIGRLSHSGILRAFADEPCAYA
jgi:hypothetical protein